MCASSIVYIHAQDDFASSPLSTACENNQLQAVKTLIENGAMVNYRNKVCFHSILAMATHCYCICAYLIGWMDKSPYCN